MKMSLLEVLSEDEIRQIHEASVHLLETCGVKVHGARMLAFLKDRGLAIDVETHVVRFSRACIEEALSTIPPQFDVFDREGRFAFTLGGGSTRVAAGHNAVFWVDSDTGQTRPSRIADVEVFARICDHLSEIHMIGVPVMPQERVFAFAAAMNSSGVFHASEFTTRMTLSTDHAKIWVNSLVL